MTDKVKISFGRSLKVGIFLCLLGSTALILLEGAYFLFGQKRLLFNGPSEFALLLIYLIGLLLLWGMVIGVGEGIISCNECER